MSLKLGLRNKIRGSRVAGGFVGLLDQPFATGATAAYSLRLLRAKHSGGLIRVRADDSGTSKGEADVLPALQPDGSKIITLDSPIENFTGTPFSGDGYVLADLVDAGNGNYDGLISNWYGQTPNKNDATQSNASQQPQIVNAGSLIKENGKPAVEFDGSSKFSADYGGKSQPFSFFIVHSPDSSSDMDVMDGQPQTDRILFDYSGGNFRMFAGSSFDTGKSWVASQNLNFLLYNSSSSKFGLDGGSLVTGGDVGTMNLDQQFIGSPSGAGPTYDGTMQELIIYDLDQSSNRTEIETNINSFYSIF